MSDHQLAEDACSIRGILELLEDPAAIITVSLVEFTQHVNRRTALRLVSNLVRAGVIEHPTKDTDILGAKQKVPCIGWIFTEKARRGEMPTAEELARGTA